MQIRKIALLTLSTLILLPGLLCADGLFPSSTTAPPPETPAISTDRPGFMDSTDVVPVGMTQVEGGTSWNGAAGARSVGLGDHIIRMGVARRLEFRVSHDGYVRSTLGGSSMWAPGSFGAKIALTSGMSLVTQLAQPGVWEPTIRVNWTRNLAGGIGIGGALDYAALRDSHGRFGQRAASLSLSRGFGDWTPFIEGYVLDRLERNGSHVSVFNGGFTRAIGRNAQIDLSAGHSFASARQEWFVSAGICIRRSALGWLGRTLWRG